MNRKKLTFALSLMLLACCLAYATPAPITADVPASSCYCNYVDKLGALNVQHTDKNETLKLAGLSLKYKF